MTSCNCPCDEVFSIFFFPKKKKISNFFKRRNARLGYRGGMYMCLYLCASFDKTEGRREQNCWKWVRPVRECPHSSGERYMTFMLTGGKSWILCNYTTTHTRISSLFLTFSAKKITWERDKKVGKRQDKIEGNDHHQPTAAVEKYGCCVCFIFFGCLPCIHIIFVHISTS